MGIHVGHHVTLRIRVRHSAAASYQWVAGALRRRVLKMGQRFISNLRFPRDDEFVILRSFFDGGNQPDSRLYDVVSLACVSGITEQWTAFEADWKRSLKKHGAPWLHTTDAVSLKKKPLTEAHGWTKAKRDAFLSDCVAVVENHLGIVTK
jgi:hypothetical protein